MSVYGFESVLDNALAQHVEERCRALRAFMVVGPEYDRMISENVGVARDFLAKRDLAGACQFLARAEERAASLRGEVSA